MSSKQKKTAAMPASAEAAASAPDRTGRPLRVLIADDHAIVRQGLRQVLADEFGVVACEEAGDARETLARVNESRWDIVLLDISMPGQSGLDVLKQIKSAQPEIRVLVLSMHPEDQYAVRVLKAGASGYLTKNTASELVARAIRKVLNGGTYVSPALAEELAQSLTVPREKAPHELLSDREYQIMRLIAAGKSVKEISYDLGLSVKTVSTYRTRLLGKLKLTTTADVIRYAVREGLVDS
jgi:two-component system, NarL family, invasion response regulator UvrY